jgi:hypothetical protein
MTYYIWLNNFDYYHEKSFDAIAEAVEFAKTLGFEYSIFDDMGSMVA